MGDFEFNHEKLRLAKAVREVYDDHEMDEDDLKDALVLLKKLRALGFCLRKIRKGPWDHPEEDGTIANHGWCLVKIIKKILPPSFFQNLHQ